MMMMAEVIDDLWQFDSEIRRPLSVVSPIGSDSSLNGLLEEKAKLGEILVSHDFPTFNSLVLNRTRR